ncbi:MAG: HdeD family acid-resistance protein [Candidatus Rokuibacteriota bacterium]
MQTLARNWWAVVLRGVFAVLFGLGAFLWPGLTLAVLVLLYGGYLFIDGILAILWALSKRREGAFSWEVFLVGLASLAAGVLTLLWPGVTAIALLYLIAAWAIIRGIFEILAAFRLRRELSNEWLLALNGVLSVVFGIILIVAPGAGALAVLWLIGSFAIVVGIVMIVLGFRLRSVKNAGARRLAYGR